jgi:hypothetical protein
MQAALLPPPDDLVCASCKEVILWSELQRLVCEFADDVRGEYRDHLLCVDMSGKNQTKERRIPKRMQPEDQFGGLF